MTLHVLKAASRLNLRAIRAEVTAAHEEGLISTPWYETILKAHEVLSTSIAAAADSCEPTDPESPTLALGDWS